MSKLDVLTPQNSQLIFIDHQPQMAFGVQSIDRQALKNNTVALAKSAKIFDVPTIITTVETESFSGNTYPELLDVFPDGSPPRRSYIDPESLGRAVFGLMSLALSGRDLPKAVNLARGPLLDMGALAEAAGACYHTQPAPAGAAPEVGMDLSRLFALLPEMAAPVSAANAVRAWERCRPA